MSKYSSGPWSNDGTEVGTGILHDIKVAKCYGADYDEARANARLIAQSPELGDILQQALPYLREAGKTDGHAWATYNHAVNVLKRAGVE